MQTDDPLKFEAVDTPEAVLLRHMTLRLWSNPGPKLAVEEQAGVLTGLHALQLLNTGQVIDAIHVDPLDRTDGEKLRGLNRNRVIREIQETTEPTLYLFHHLHTNGMRVNQEPMFSMGLVVRGGWKNQPSNQAFLTHTAANKLDEPIKLERILKVLPDYMEAAGDAASCRIIQETTGIPNPLSVLRLLSCMATSSNQPTVAGKIMHAYSMSRGQKPAIVQAFDPFEL